MIPVRAFVFREILRPAKTYFYGEYLMNAQGEDVVAGIRTPEKLSKLAEQDEHYL